MFHAIGGLFDRHALVALREAVTALSWEDGARTAGALARRVKQNAQAADTPARSAVLRKVEKAVDGLSDSGPISAVGTAVGTLF